MVDGSAILADCIESESSALSDAITEDSSGCLSFWGLGPGVFVVVVVVLVVVVVEFCRLLEASLSVDWSVELTGRGFECWGPSRAELEFRFSLELASSGVASAKVQPTRILELLISRATISSCTLRLDLVTWWLIFWFVAVGNCLQFVWFYAILLPKKSTVSVAI